MGNLACIREQLHQSPIQHLESDGHPISCSHEHMQDPRVRLREARLLKPRDWTSDSSHTVAEGHVSSHFAQPCRKDAGKWNPFARHLGRVSQFRTENRGWHGSIRTTFVPERAAWARAEGISQPAEAVIVDGRSSTSNRSPQCTTRPAINQEGQTGRNLPKTMRALVVACRPMLGTAAFQPYQMKAPQPAYEPQQLVNPHSAPQPLPCGK